MLNLILKLPILKRIIPSILTRLLKLTKKNKGYFKINNFFMYLDFLDPIDREIILKKKYESEEINFFCDLIKKNSITKFIDIGANCGYFSFFFTNKFKNIKTIAFEPNIRAYEKLKKTFKKNRKFKNKIVIKNFGLSNKNCILKMMSMIKSENVHTNSSIIKKKINDPNLIYSKAKFKIGDQVLKLKNKILAIKIDVEGHEMYVLKGLKQLISNNQCFIMLEIGNKNFKKTNSFLINNNYNLIYSSKFRKNYFYSK